MTTEFMISILILFCGSLYHSDNTRLRAIIFLPIIMIVRSTAFYRCEDILWLTVLRNVMLAGAWGGIIAHMEDDAGFMAQIERPDCLPIVLIGVIGSLLLSLCTVQQYLCHRWYSPICCRRSARVAPAEA